ncbi:hypothetical protein D0439_10020 [Lysinibacillus fusiformis]|uniref:hypothetical protein n=1 Tax=Lysinibacillus fusiformis TaxID=28031 RepID=UPI0011BB181D|nr:hypothetical protein [Lysinibacillus fusiformis]QDZ98948.1 hypothetical protein D0439_10020 [Lysinibacillus fusiformis]
MIEIDEQIEREQACIEDLMTEIKIHVQNGQINIAMQRDRDLHNSLKQLEKLHERKRLWITVEVLNKRGVLAKVVKKYAHQT